MNSHPRTTVRLLVAAAAITVVASACVPPIPADDIVEFEADYFGLGYGGWDDSPMASAPAADGGIVVAGRTEPPGGDLVVSKLLASGSKDPAFAGGGNAVVGVPDDAEIVEVVVDPAGKTIVLLAVFPDAAAPSPLLLRFLPNGGLDPTFADAGVLDPEDAEFFPSDVLAMPDGRYVVAGAALSEAEPIAAAAMILNDGELDEDFGDEGLRGLLPDAWATVVERLPDGRLIVAGSSGLENEEDLPTEGFAFAIPATGVGAGTGGKTPLSATTDIAVDPAGRAVIAGLTQDFRGQMLRYPAALPTSGGSLVPDPSFGADGVTTIDSGDFDASLVRSIDFNSENELIGTAWIANVEGDDDPEERLFRTDPNGELNKLLGEDGLLRTGLQNPAVEILLHAGVSVFPNDVIWVPAPVRDGALGAWVGKFLLPDPTPPPECPTAPVRVTAENFAGASIARWICGMEMVGTIWRGEGVIMLLPRGYFTCPSVPEIRYFDSRAEFGFYLLQAKCGYRPVGVDTWFGRWLAWTPPL